MISPAHESAALESVRYLVLMIVNRCLRARPRLRRHAEDIEQESMIDALGAIRTWKPGAGSKLSSWVATTVEYKLRRHWRLYSEAKGIHVPLTRWDHNGLDDHDRLLLRPGAPMEAAEMVPVRDNGGSAEARALEAADEVRARIAILPSQLRKIVCRRLGILGRARETLLEIGDDLGLTSERVRQLEEKAMTRLGVASVREIAGAA